MKRAHAVSLSLSALVLAGLGLVVAARVDAHHGGPPPAHDYVGPKRCKMCHNKAEKGAQFDKWLAGPHAKTFQTLASDEAKAVAKKKGIEDPQKADECLGCHVTGHGVPQDKLGKNWDMTEGVSCEGCHGFGGDYWKKSVMEDREKAMAAGLVVPDAETCKSCHNEESPTFKGFDYEKYAARIAHPDPTTP